LLIVIYMVAFCTLILELWLNITGERDISWGVTWIFEATWFSMFNLFMLSVMIIMRPNEHSRMLAMMVEIG